MSSYMDTGRGRPPRLEEDTCTWPMSFRLEYLAKMYLTKMAQDSQKSQVEILEHLIYDGFQQHVRYGLKLQQPAFSIRYKKGKVVIEIPLNRGDAEPETIL